MYITQFHIDGLGILRDVSVENLSPGLNIFLGRNESGKTTCMEFLRTVLTGTGSGRGNYDKMLRNAEGGTLFLQEDGKTFQVSRKMNGRGAGLKIFNEIGEQLDETLLDELMNHISRQTYSTLFGFSLTELQNMSSLAAPEISDALYGASFGMGLQGPDAALKDINQQMDKIYKPRGSSGIVNQLLKDWDGQNRAVNDAAREVGEFDGLQLELREKESLLQKILAQHKMEEQCQRLTEKEKFLWQQQSQWQNLKSKQELLPLLCTDFPDHALQNLELRLERKKQAEQNLANLQQRRQKLAADRDAIRCQPELLHWEAAVQNLSEQKTGFRKAAAALPELRRTLSSATVKFHAALADLGTNWTPQRMQSVPHDHAVSTRIEELRTALYEAKSDCQKTGDAKTYAIQTLQTSKQTARQAQESFAALPAPLFPLPQSLCQTLQAELQQTKEELRQLPELEARFARKKTQIVDSAARMDMAPELLANILQDTSPAAENLKKLPEFQQSQHDAEQREQKLAALATENGEQAAQAETRLQQLEENSAQLRQKQTELAGLSASEIVEHKLALKNLRQGLADEYRETMLIAENQAGTENLEAMIQAERNGVLPIAAACLCALCGGGMLLFRLVGGQEAADFSAWRSLWASLLPQWDGLLPMPLWTSILLLLAATSFVLLMLPRRRARIRHQEILEQRRQHGEKARTQLESLHQTNAETAKFLEISEFLDAKPEHINAALEDKDDALEEALRRFHALEKCTEELSALDAELEAAQRLAQQKNAAFQDTKSQLLRLRQERTAFFASYGIRKTPASVTPFFAQLSRLLEDTAELRRLAQSIHAANSRPESLKIHAEQHIPAEFMPQEENFLPQLEELLQTCALANLRAPDRVRAEQESKNAQAAVLAAQKKLEQAAAQVQNACQKATAAVEHWNQYTQQSGLAAELSAVRVNLSDDAAQHCDTANPPLPIVQQLTVCQQEADDAAKLAAALRRAEELFHTCTSLTQQVEENSAEVLSFLRPLVHIYQEITHSSQPYSGADTPNADVSSADTPNTTKCCTASSSYSGTANFAAAIAGQTNNVAPTPVLAPVSSAMPDTALLNACAEWDARFSKLAASVEDARKKSIQKEEKDRQFTETAIELESAIQNVQEAKDALAALLAQAQAPSVDEFRRMASIDEQRRTLTQRCHDLEQGLFAAARDYLTLAAQLPAAPVQNSAAEDTSAPSNFAADFASGTAADSSTDSTVSFGANQSAPDGVPADVMSARIAKESPDMLLTRLSALTEQDFLLRQNLHTETLEKYAEQEERLHADCGRLRARCDHLLQSTVLSDRRQALLHTESCIAEAYSKWARLALARRLLEESRKQYERDCQPDVIRKASALYAAITDGRWSTVTASVSDKTLRVMAPNSEPLSPEFLSRGAQEQLYLALRLAHIQNHAQNHHSLPVLMDDILVNFDEARAASTAQAIAKLVTPDDPKIPSTQIFFYTCHPSTVQLLQKYIAPSALFSMKHGIMTPSEIFSAAQGA